MSTKLTGYVWDGCAASGMKLSSVAIMARLADFSNDEGVCWPSIETIARQIGAGMSTVRTAIARLEAEGWLTRKARRQGNHSHSLSGTAASAGAHAHTVGIGAHTHSVAIGSHGHTITVNAAGNAENTVKNIAFNYIVRLA
ncbi:helix-turn-helix domain-containing protein [Escherichia coli]|nr:helix-turn-helix domain-containing protein [Escherichia coli]HAL7313695.1 helix-turn-helix domain-containing protein [Escherichia coli]